MEEALFKIFAAQDYTFDERQISHIPLRSLQEKNPQCGLYISGLNGYGDVVHGRAKMDVVISLCQVQMLDRNTVAQHYKYNIMDEISAASDMKKILEEVTPIIYKALRSNKKVLVHCAAGVSRSATVILYYLAMHHASPLVTKDDTTIPSIIRAARFLKKIRPCVCPNEGFVRLLCKIAV